MLGGCLALLLLVPLGQGQEQQRSAKAIPAVVPEGRTRPVLQWTAAGDPLNFRYVFLDNLKTTTLLTATPESGTWNHHQHIFYIGDVFYAVWDTQIKDENGAGQHGVMRRSTDQGRTWTPVEQLFPPSARNVPAADPYPETRFQTFSGCAVIEGMLYAVTDVAEWTTSGQKKVKPRRKIGRMCRSIGSDGTLGPIFWLLSTAPEPVQGFPAYPGGDPALVARIEDFFRQPGQEIQLDFAPRAHPDSDDNHVMAEPVPSYQLADGTWVRLYRDSGARGARTLKEEEETKSRRNYVSFSFDGGQTWTVPTRTSFPDACARSNVGKLPDGQVYVINNVLPLATKQGGRSLLAISLSRDGLNFDRMAVIRFLPPPLRHEGRSKAVGYAYPHSVIVGEHLWVIYSVNKEDIEVTRIPLSELMENTKVAQPAVAASAADRGPAQDTPSALIPPYPPSDFIESLTIDAQRISIGDGDNWANTWGDDDYLYAFPTDGRGFDRTNRVSCHPVIIEGHPPQISGRDLDSPTGTIPNTKGQHARKVCGLLMVDGVLYAWVRNMNLPGTPLGTGAGMMVSTDRGRTWEWLDWNWPELGYPVWMNAGRNYQAAPDKYAYYLSPNGPSAYADYPDMVLARVMVASIRDQAAHEFFAGFSNPGVPRWGRFESRKPVFTDPSGCFRPNLVYNPGLKRYLLVMSSPYGKWGWWATDNPNRRPHFGMFEAPNPWGPWTVVDYIADWGAPENRFAPNIPSKWISDDGTGFYLLYSCIPNGPYQFNVQRCTVKLKGP